MANGNGEWWTNLGYGLSTDINKKTHIREKHLLLSLTTVLCVVSIMYSTRFCVKFFPANACCHIHQSFTLRVIIDPIGQFG